MEVSSGEGIANHTGPESCRCVRKEVLEALTKEGAGSVLSRESYSSGAPVSIRVPSGEGAGLPTAAEDRSIRLTPDRLRGRVSPLCARARVRIRAQGFVPKVLHP